MVVMSAQQMMAESRKVKEQEKRFGPAMPYNPTPIPGTRNGQNPAQNGPSIRDLKRGLAGHQNSSMEPLGRPSIKRMSSPAIRQQNAKPPVAEEPPVATDTFKLVSIAPSEWKHSVMIFRPPNNDTQVDILKDFREPIKLNRKQPKSQIYVTPASVANGPLKELRGPDGNPVYGPDGKIIMVNSEGQTTISLAKAAAKAVNAKGKEKEKEKEGAKKKGFNKPKTKQTFLASEEVRQKRREEYNPWVLEDAGGGQEWVGRIDNRNDNQIYALLEVDHATQSFKFIPVHRYYNFIDKRQHSARMNADVANDAWTKKKLPDIATEFSKRTGQVSQATQAFANRVKVESERQANQPRIKRESGNRKAEGEYEEMEWEENFDDDDEGDRHEEMEEDEEEKRTQERLKKQYLTANKLEGAIDDDDDEDMEDVLNSDGRQIKDSLKRMGHQEYDDESDEDEDEYSKRYGSAKPPEPVNNEPLLTGVRQQPTPSLPTKSTPAPLDIKPSIPLNKNLPSSVAPLQKGPGGTSTHHSNNASSPVSPGAGAALVARRATSPKRPGSRATSPVGANGVRATSPLAHGATGPSDSPVVVTSGVIRNGSPSANIKKRKAEGPNQPSGVYPASPVQTHSSDGPDKKKKKNSHSHHQGGHETSPVTANAVIAFIRANGGRVTAKDLARNFKSKDGHREELIALVTKYGVIDHDGNEKYISLKPNVA